VIIVGVLCVHVRVACGIIRYSVYFLRGLVLGVGLECGGGGVWR
jgi:hypothetical protein